MGSPLPELDLAPGTLLIADLHLDVEDEAALAGFGAFLERNGSAPRLAILGDLFEYWLGPAHARTPGGERVLAALRALTASGTAVDVVPGNRDFLLDASFEEASGARVRRDGFVGRLPDGGRVLVIHGDELATRDRGYQRLRRVLRSGPLLWLAPRLPLGVSRSLARRLRRASIKAVAAKPSEEKALQADACAAFARAHAATTVVCGHAHEFRDEEVVGGPRWIVLDAFGGRRDTLAVERGGLRFASSARPDGGGAA